MRGVTWGTWGPGRQCTSLQGARQHGDCAAPLRQGAAGAGAGWGRAGVASPAPSPDAPSTAVTRAAAGLAAATASPASLGHPVLHLPAPPAVVDPTAPLVRLQVFLYVPKHPHCPPASSSKPPPPPQPCWVLITHISVSPSISCCSIMLTLCPHPSALGCPPQSALGSSVLLVSLPAPPQSSPLLWVSPWPWGCPLSQCPHGLGTLVPWALLPRPCGCPHPLGALSCGIPRVSPLHGCPIPRCPLVVPNLWLPHPGVPQSIPVVAPPKRAVSLQRSPQ